MSEARRVLLVNTLHHRGGAAQVARNLHRAYRARGVHSWMAVKREVGEEPGVRAIPNDASRPWTSRALLRAARWCGRFGPPGRVGRRTLKWVAEPRRRWEVRRGVEDFHYPGTWKLLDLPPEPPEIVHCHNLHGGYFDLRALPWLSQRVPVVLTLHDAWLLSGHCAHSLGCERWRFGCGECPDLTIYPAVQRDATAYNWRRKRKIFQGSRLYVSTPSRWLMRKVESSMLADAVLEARVIPNGVDLDVFRPGDRDAARRALDIPRDAAVLLLAADSIRRNPWRDWEMARAALESASRSLGDRRLFLIALGEEAAGGRIGEAEVRFVPYRTEPFDVAAYYRAADLYVHPSLADTFPNAVLEALACGTPVVATEVGGIPEQVKPLRSDRPASGGSYTGDEATGALVPAGDATALASVLIRLLQDTPTRNRLAENAAADARSRFDLRRQVDELLSWYEEILGHGGRSNAPSESAPSTQAV